MFGTKVLETRKSKYNGEIKVIKSLGYGTYIQCNNLTQSGGIVESIWKSTIRHLNHLTIKPFNHILILGLGGGTVVKVLRKYYPDAKITGVDIDPMMIELGKKYFSLDKQNVDIKIIDAKKFLPAQAGKLKKYDLIIVDGFIGDKFIDFSRSDLTRCNLVVFNKLFYRGKKEDALEFGEKLKKMFKKVDYFYPPANLMFLCYNTNSKDN